MRYVDDVRNEYVGLNKTKKIANENGRMYIALEPFGVRMSQITLIFIFLTFNSNQLNNQHLFKFN
ncbi:hypothetical protein MtrunA17_Chr5g0408191 [Medicago truncatula]|uniref:Uncharacterized protein n=1 Tax=Medicago truncatula TaxID=3880 RepID=A0A396HQ11_MEDTR|nr:hypothetical protein MtrunA17_Chr5g0408191 [Medicago truncatula]